MIRAKRQAHRLSPDVEKCEGAQYWKNSDLVLGGGEDDSFEISIAVTFSSVADWSGLTSRQMFITDRVLVGMYLAEPEAVTGPDDAFHWSVSRGTHSPYHTQTILHPAISLRICIRFVAANAQLELPPFIHTGKATMLGHTDVTGRCLL